MKIVLAGPAPHSYKYFKNRPELGIFNCLISYWDIVAKREREKTFRLIKNENIFSGHDHKDKNE